MIEKVVEMGYLFDFYGKLLSDRQYSIIEQYYIKDYSLSEIGENLDITRQGVYDTLKRAEMNLYEYENSLKLIDKFNNKNDKIKEIICISKELERELLGNELKKIKKIRSISENILNRNWEGN